MPLKQFEGSKEATSTPRRAAVLIWLDTSKIIDELHIKNHADKRCIEKNITEGGPVRGHEHYVLRTDFCTAISMFKKILSTMLKTHHHFCLHHMLQRRNVCTSQCYVEGRQPVQPKFRHVEKEFISYNLLVTDDFVRCTLCNSASCILLIENI